MKKPWPGKEWEIVLSCCREASKSRQAELPDIGEDTDWPGVIRMALKHGLINFVYLRLSENCRDLVPQETLSRFKAIYFQNSTRNTYLGVCLIRVLNEAAVRQKKSSN
jgi:hypothetical protein